MNWLVPKVSDKPCPTTLMTKNGPHMYDSIYKCNYTISSFRKEKLVPIVKKGTLADIYQSSLPISWYKFCYFCRSCWMEEQSRHRDQFCVWQKRTFTKKWLFTFDPDPDLTNHGPDQVHGENSGRDQPLIPRCRRRIHRQVKSLLVFHHSNFLRISLVHMYL